MKKIMMIAALVGLGLSLAKASTSSYIGRTPPGTSRLQMLKAEATTTVCYQLCDLNGKCYTECSLITTGK